MASKKYLLVAVLVVLFQTVGLAQADFGSNWRDSSKIPTRALPQYNEFINNQYPYPTKPRDQWELGIGAGAAILSNDWANDVGFGGTITLRKALSHTFSLRPQFSYYSNSGGGTDLNTNSHTDYKNNSMHFGVDLLTSLNTISHYRANPKSNIYFITGVEYFSTKITRSIAGAPFVDYTNPTSSASNNIGFNLGMGVAFKITEGVNIAFEVKNTLTNNDKLETYSSVYSNANDAWWYGGIKLNFNLGNKSKRVQPLWWINPNNFVYSELNKPAHMKLPKTVLPDGDGDGVTDQFDLEPNTPRGAPVDSHGVSKDSDGDGVPDYKDKELLTPQKCFPVNADGIGTCPEPACCKEIKDMVSNMKVSPAAAECNIGGLPSIQFKGNARLTKDNESVLAAAAAKINANPACKVKVIGYGASSKSAQQLSWERVNAVMKYLVEKQGISESRLVFNYGQDGDVNTVDLLGTTEDGPNNVPAPHPNLKTKN
jgi:opacity protein-like surface antigen